MKNPWFKFWVKDFLSGTRLMTTTEVGAYILLLLYQFEKEFLPDDFPTLCKIAGVKKSTLMKVIPKFELTEDGYVNSKMKEVIDDQRRVSLGQREKGMKGGRPKKSPGLIPVNPEESLSESESESDNKDNSGFVLKGFLADMLADWKVGDPGYHFEARKDLPALQEIGKQISQANGWTNASTFSGNFSAVRKKWRGYVEFIRASTFYGRMTLPDIERFFHKIINESRNIKPKTNDRGTIQLTAAEQEGKRIIEDAERARALRKNPPTGPGS